MKLLDKQHLIEEIEKIIPDWHMYYYYEIDDMTVSDIINELEWEIWLR